MAHNEHIRVINDPDVLRLIADPLRLRLLELLRQEPHTVKELAALLDVPRTKLYYHVRLLEERGLIAVEGTRVVSGITEKRYRVTAYRLSVEKALLGGQDGDNSPLEVYLSLVLDEVAAEIRRSIASGLLDLDALHEDAFKPRNLVIGRQWFRFTDDQLADFARKYEALFESFEANAVFGPDAIGDGPDEGKYYEFLTSFYPVVPPSGTTERE